MPSASATQAINHMRASDNDLKACAGIETPEALEDQISFITDRFGSLGKLINLFILENFDCIKEKSMKTRSLTLMAHYMDMIIEFDTFSQLVKESFNRKAVPFDFVELVKSGGPVPDPVTFTFCTGDKESTDTVPQCYSKKGHSTDFEKSWDITVDKSGAMPVDYRFKIQFTPSSSMAGGSQQEDIDLALRDEYQSATTDNFSNIGKPAGHASGCLDIDAQPSTYMSATFDQRTPSAGSTSTAASAGSEGTSGDSSRTPGRKLRKSKKMQTYEGKGKGKEKAVTPADDAGAPRYPLRSRKEIAPLTAPSTTGGWNGLTKALRSVAAAVIESSSHNAQSSSSSSRGRKRKARDEDDNDLVQNNELFRTKRKKRGGKR